MNILRLSERVKLKLGEVTVLVSPLSFAKKSEIAKESVMSDGILVPDYAKQSFLLVKHSVKDVTGLTDYAGNEYKLTFDGAEVLTDDCAIELVDCFSGTKLAAAIGKVSTSNLNVEGVELDVVPKQ
jgi:hypothetical protein